ncbi:hypothetical protein ACIBF5_16615 [Micromonospora sp. NPDC050417]|uniref:hypothetical protein n=1 Tax=Micromonospora sp. NPDC050417 TaxID=3364280 RepID=UPI00379366D9
MDDDAPVETGPGSPAEPSVSGWRRFTRPARLPVLALVTYAVTQLVLLFWWVAFYPGLFSPDSLNYMWQSTTGNWNTHHPVTYTALVWLSLQLTNGVGALTLLQTVALAAGLAYAVTGLRRLGGPAWLWTAAAAILVALPPVGSFTLAVWKDVPFVICHVFLLGTVARLVVLRRRTPGPDRPRLPRSLFVALMAELTLLCLFRQNGFIVTAVLIVICVLVLRGMALRMIVAAVTAVTIALLTNWLLLPVLGVRNTGSLVAWETLFGDIAVGYADDPAAFSVTDTAVMAQVAPLSHWRSSADCYSVDPTVWHPDFNRTATAAHKSELVSIWVRLAQRSPGTVLGARFCRSSIAWQPASTGNVARNPNPWSVRTYVQRDPLFRASPARRAAYSAPLSQRIGDLAVQLNARTVTPEWLWWRGASWAYLAYLVVGLVAWRRRDRTVLALAGLSAGNQLSVLAINNMQGARYMFVPYVLGVVLLPLLLTARPPATTTAAATPAPAETATVESTTPDHPTESGSPASTGSGQVG